ncbi:capsular polysaccharide export protein [Gammaproteobacteria bacterium]
MTGGGANSGSGLPRLIVEPESGLEGNKIPSAEHVGPWMLEAIPTIIRHYIVGVLLSPFFPGYRHHRLYHPIHEGMLWLWRFVTNPVRKIVEAVNVRNVINYLGDHFVFPLQLEGDSQLRAHSDYSSINECVDHVIGSFARYAPTTSHLFIKPHPLDPRPWVTRRWVKKTIATYNISERVHWADTPGIGILLHEARGLVTINSTVGLLALGRRIPTKVLGRAFWDLPKITHKGDLDSFWKTQMKPEYQIFETFKKAIMLISQINGGFYSKKGLNLLIPRLAQAISCHNSTLDIRPSPSKNSKNNNKIDRSLESITAAISGDEDIPYRFE